MDEDLTAAASIAWNQALLAPIIEINERMLEQLHTAACVARAAHSVQDIPELLQRLLHDWCALDAAAQHRLAQCPYVLIDAGLDDPLRWQSSGALAVHETAEPRHRGAGLWMGEAWLALVRRTLLLAWHMARAQPLAARVLLGMGAASAECFAARRLADLDELAAQEAGRVCPRWHHQPQVWRQLLRASHGSVQELRWTQLRGLQLLAAARTATTAGTAAQADRMSRPQL